MAILYGDETASTVRRSQVYQATHNGEGQTLPYMNRSFISFTYGGKKIEDFDLIATISGDRLNRPGYASFEDTVTTYDNLDGQYYWATHYKTNQLDLTLSTDGIDQKQLDNFLHWFKAGISRELILAEHPNRAIMARVADTPTLNLLPFEHNVDIVISSNTYKTKTTLYKGDIQLKLVMNKPHWYAITNILGKRVESSGGGADRFVDVWDDPFTGKTDVSIFASQDALKILYEDGIPLGSMISSNMLLGNGAYANVDTQTTGKIWSKLQSESGLDWTAEPALDSDFWTVGEGARINGTVTGEEEVPSAYAPGNYVGIIAGAIVNADNKGIVSLAQGQQGYFFYAGTAPSPTIISFDVPLLFNSSGYCITFNDEIVSSNNLYNTLTIESTEKQELKFTSPNLIHSYNTAVQIIQSEYLPNAYMLQIRNHIIEKVKHPQVRAWMLALLSSDKDKAPEEIDPQSVAEHLMQFFQNDDGETEPIHLSFNSETGEALGTMYYRHPNAVVGLTTFVWADNAHNKISTITSYDDSLTDKQRYENLVTWGWAQYCIQNETLYEPSDSDEATYTEALTIFKAYLEECKTNKVSLPTIFTVLDSPIQHSTYFEATEDVGDMLYSNYIIIKERNYPTAEGKIVGWYSTNDDTKRYSHRVYHNITGELKNLQILYKNMYL